AGNTNISTEDRESSKDDEWRQHYPRAFMNSAVSVWRGRPRPRYFVSGQMCPMPGMLFMSMLCPRCSPVVAKESHEQQSKHVEGRDKRGHNPDQPIYPAGLIGAPQDFVFAEETRETRNSRDCASSDKHRSERPGDLSPKPAHLAHVLLAAHCM